MYAPPASKSLNPNLFMGVYNKVKSGTLFFSGYNASQISNECASIFLYFNVSQMLLIWLPVPLLEYTCSLIRAKSAAHFFQIWGNFWKSMKMETWQSLTPSKIQRIIEVFSSLWCLSRGLVQSSNARAFGSHPRGQGFESLQVHQTRKIRTCFRLEKGSDFLFSSECRTRNNAKPGNPSKRDCRAFACVICFYSIRSRSTTGCFWAAWQLAAGTVAPSSAKKGRTAAMGQRVSR